MGVIMKAEHDSGNSTKSELAIISNLIYDIGIGKIESNDPRTQIFALINKLSKSN